MHPLAAWHLYLVEVFQLLNACFLNHSDYTIMLDKSLFAARRNLIYDVIADRTVDWTCPSTSLDSMRDLLARFTRDPFRSTQRKTTCGSIAAEAKAWSSLQSSKESTPLAQPVVLFPPRHQH